MLDKVPVRVGVKIARAEKIIYDVRIFRMAKIKTKITKKVETNSYNAIKKASDPIVVVAKILT